MPDTLNPERHRGRLAVVTGARRGIGLAIARRLIGEGARVILVDRDQIDQEVLTELITAAAPGLEPEVVLGDVSSVEDTAKIVERARELGGADILINNAAIQPFSPFGAIEPDAWDAIFAVNVRGLYLLSRGLLPQMEQKGRGRIVAMASTMFHMGTQGAPHYASTKGAIIGLVRSLAPEVGSSGVTVNAIAPGLVRTPGTLEGPQEEFGIFDAVRDMQCIKRTLQPDDMTGAVSFLVSDDAEVITGQTLVVDGGMARA
ncbi:MAG: SDR family oxidoreductase [Rhodococcus sp. (in: high G+C Gram-positive bacteria)]|uniref:SDR family NAD(P)-dependent oxidoreductase n=1 Tax=Rhodococcus sp. TaxID=1831 RepID=UPI002ADBA5AF|nr:SDR family oxidoreductase [Rhodococcus sp. (in: high G+C Gram-positive bacteria)]